MAANAPTSAAGGQPGQPMTERKAWCLPGAQVLILAIALLIAGVLLPILTSKHHGTAAVAFIWLGIVLAVAGGSLFGGLTQVQPGKARVVQLFGQYRGTVRQPGLQ